MDIEFKVTIAIAAAGWVWAIFQYINNRRRFKKDKLADRRYESYFAFIRKLEEISSNTRNNPESITNASQHFISEILKPNVDVDGLLLYFSQEMFSHVKKATEPLQIINQEISSLMLIASDDLVDKLNELKKLIIDFNNEMQNALAAFNIKDPNAFKVLETVGHDTRWQRIKSLNEEIIKLMRGEINI